MIGIFDVAVGTYLDDVFGSVINNGTDSIFFSEPQLVREERQVREGKGVEVGYPFISYWRSPFAFDEDNFNRKLQTLGVSFCLPSTDIEETLEGVFFRFVHVETTYTVNFYEGKNFRNATIFNLEWVDAVENDRERSFTLPVKDREDDLELKYTMNLASDLTDNSDIERRYEKGVNFRYTGDITVNGMAALATLQDGELDPERRQAINEVMLCLFLENEKETDEDDILVQQIIEK